MLRSASLRSGVTRLDVVVGVLAAIVTVVVLLPGCFNTAAREDDRRNGYNIKRMCIALHDCASMYDTLMPPSRGTFMGKSGTWFFHLLPFIEQDNLWKMGNTTTPVRTYCTLLDPSCQENRPLTSYASNSALFGVSPQSPPRMPASFGEKGTSSTIVVMNRYAVAGGNAHGWGDTGDGVAYLDGSSTTVEYGVPPEKASNTAAHAFTASGLSVGLGDGSWRTITSAVSQQTFRWACDPKGKMPPPSDW
jgi:hypothetical protein